MYPDSSFPWQTPHSARPRESSNIMSRPARGMFNISFLKSARGKRQPARERHARNRSIYKLLATAPLTILFVLPDKTFSLTPVFGHHLSLPCLTYIEGRFSDVITGGPGQRQNCDGMRGLWDGVYVGDLELRQSPTTHNRHLGGEIILLAWGVEPCLTRVRLHFSIDAHE